VKTFTHQCIQFNLRIRVFNALLLQPDGYPIEMHTHDLGIV